MCNEFVEFKSEFIGDLNLTNLLEITDQIPIVLLLIKSVNFDYIRSNFYTNNATMKLILSKIMLHYYKNKLIVINSFLFKNANFRIL